MGFVGIDRGLRDHWIYQDAEYLKVWMEMLFLARFSEEPHTELIDGDIIQVEYGQFIFGRIKWSQRLKIGEQRLRTLMSKLKKEQMIELVLEHRKCSVYALVNYAKFNHESNHQSILTQQGFEASANHQTNQQPTISQPSPNHQSTTKEQGSNKVNKGNKVNKELKDTPQFDEFWNMYPRRVGNVDALNAWNNAIKRGAIPEDIYKSVENYKINISFQGTETQFIKHPASFLNKDRWKEYLNQLTVLKGGQANASKPEQRRPTNTNQYYASDPTKGTQTSVQSAASGGSHLTDPEYDLDNLFVRR